MSPQRKELLAFGGIVALVVAATLLLIAVLQLIGTVPIPPDSADPQFLTQPSDIPILHDPNAPIWI